MLAEAKSEGDRACALVLAANLENRLKELLLTYFVPLSKQDSEKLFNGQAPLATFSSRIKLAWVSGLLSEEEEHDLNVIRGIRNEFAHGEHGLSFETKAIRDRCASLKMPSEMTKQYPEHIDSAKRPRSRYQITAASLTLLLANRNASVLLTKRAPHPATSILTKRDGPVD
ncbi:MltR family transcriptional regulator [Thermomonas carbonis]